MAVPDSSSIKLSDVVTELGLSLPRGLLSCFANAVSGSFDPAYSGAKDRLSNFRNYGAVLLPGETFLDEIFTAPDDTTVFRINNTTDVIQDITMKITLISSSFSDPGVTKITWLGGELFYVGDSHTYTSVGGNLFPSSTLGTLYLSGYGQGDNCTITCEVIALGVDILPTPIGVNIQIPFPV